MKQLKILLLTLALAMTCGVASAQKGMQGVGGNVGCEFEMSGSMGTYDIFPIVDLKYQYNASNYYRLEPFFSYGFISGHQEIQTGLNNHLFISKVRRCRPYFVAGFGFGFLKRNGGFEFSQFCDGYIWDIIDDRPNYYDGVKCIENVKSISEKGFYWRGGLGLDCRFSHTWSGQLELCGDGLIASKNKISIQLKFGVAYNF